MSCCKVFVQSLIRSGLLKLYRWYPGQEKEKITAIGITKIKIPNWENSIAPSDDNPMCWPHPNKAGENSTKCSKWFSGIYFSIFFKIFSEANKNLIVRAGKSLAKVLQLFKTAHNAPLCSFLAYGSGKGL